MNRRSALTLISTVVITMSAAGSAPAGQKENVDGLYKLIIERADNTIAGSGEWKGQRTDYTGKDNPKALVICINWRDVSPTRYERGEFYVRTGSSDNPPRSVNAAVAEATNRCKARCKATCVVADRNGQNALRPPADWYR
jgi:hypothetical protein